METFVSGALLSLDIQKQLRTRDEGLKSDLDQALETAQNRLRQVSASPEDRASCLGDLHWLYLKKGDRKQSDHYFEEGRKAALAVGSHSLLARIDMNQVLYDYPNAQLCLPKLHEALESFNLSYAPQDSRWQKGKADCLAQLSALYIQENRHALAIDLIIQWARHKERFHLE